MLKDIHHVSLLTTDVDRSIHFYTDILDLAVSDKRPDLGFDGAWFEIGGQQIHLIQSEPVSGPGETGVRCGRDRHVAFRVDDIDLLVERLDNAGIEFERSRSGRPALFCRDPDGNALEFIDSN
jgi:glyoxylase I family protein